MANLRRSPERFTFQKESYLDRKANEGKTPENDESVAAMSDFFDSFLTQTLSKEADPNWAINNLEYDLRTTDWLIEKVKQSEAYAQNLYAALCNNDFQKIDTWPILSDQRWSCSWRYAGGIIADIREQGDYIDWYCSGIRDIDYDEEVNKHWDARKYVAEGVVTEEILKDLRTLGWALLEINDENI